MKVLAFVGTPGGGDSAIVAYNLAWMYAQMGLKTLCVDLTTAARLSEMFYREAQLADFWPLFWSADEEWDPEDDLGRALFSTLWPALSRVGEPNETRVRVDHSELSRQLRIRAGVGSDPVFEELRDHLAVVVGDPAAARCHGVLEQAWCDANMAREQRLAHLLACRRMIHGWVNDHRVDLVVVDLGTEMSPLTRAGLLAADASFVVTAPTAGSRRGLETIERLLPVWRAHWTSLTEGAGTTTGFAEPTGAIDIDMRPSPIGPPPRCLARLRFLRTLEPLSRESGKPIFLLTPSDGAMGGYAAAVFDARRELRDLARAIARRADVTLPSSDDQQPREEKT